MAHSADPDELASLEANILALHCLQRQGISGFSRTRIKSGQEKRQLYMYLRTTTDKMLQTKMAPRKITKIISTFQNFEKVSYLEL